MYTKVVIIEDNKELIEFVKTFLKENGQYQVVGYEKGSTALNELKSNKPDIVLLDLMLDDIKGETVCIELRKMYPTLPIIILTGNISKESIIHCLEIGADDYITKPFDAQELLARMTACLRRAHIQTESILQVDDLVINTDTLEVHRRGKPVDLTAKEFELLKYLIINAGRTLTRDKIFDAVWGYDAILDTRVIDVHIGKLRQKINKGAKKKLITTYRGFGYRIG